MKKPAANRVTRLDVEQMRLITKVARLHHTQGQRQSEIADKLGISQASVSRFLTLAQVHGIVRTVVVPPAGLFEVGFAALTWALLSTGLESATVYALLASTSIAVRIFLCSSLRGAKQSLISTLFRELISESLMPLKNKK